MPVGEITAVLGDVRHAPAARSIVPLWLHTAFALLVCADNRTRPPIIDSACQKKKKVAEYDSELQICFVGS
jgi:hypothetical protein